MKVKKMQYRQGDVLIERVEMTEERFNKGQIVPNDGGRVILAYGEVTGHAHALPSSKVVMRETEDGERYIYVRSPCFLLHEEHSGIRLNGGYYQIIRQREYTPEAIRNVAD